MEICASYEDLSENWFLDAFNVVLGKYLFLYDDLCIGKINGLHIWKLESQIYNL